MSSLSLNLKKHRELPQMQTAAEAGRLFAITANHPEPRAQACLLVHIQRRYGLKTPGDAYAFTRVRSFPNPLGRVGSCALWTVASVLAWEADHPNVKVNADTCGLTFTPISTASATPVAEVATEKRCIACGKLKPLADFNLQSKREGTTHSYCRACQLELVHGRVQLPYGMLASGEVIERSDGYISGVDLAVRYGYAHSSSIHTLKYKLGFPGTVGTGRGGSSLYRLSEVQRWEENNPSLRPVKRAIAANANIANKETNPVTAENRPLADTPRSLTRAEKRRIANALDDVYPVDEKGYINGATDASVATRLHVPRAWVTWVREFDYGPERVVNTSLFESRLKLLDEMLEAEKSRSAASLESLDKTAKALRADLNAVLNLTNTDA